MNENDTLYKSFLDHKIYSKINNVLLKSTVKPEDSLFLFQCFICEHVHKGTLIGNATLKNNSIYNCPKSAVNNKTTWHQHWEIGRCQSKALTILQGKNKQYSRNNFDKMWKKFFIEGNC